MKYVRRPLPRMNAERRRRLAYIERYRELAQNRAVGSPAAPCGHRALLEPHLPNGVLAVADVVDRKPKHWVGRDHDPVSLNLEARSTQEPVPYERAR